NPNPPYQPSPDPTPGNQEIDFRELLPILARRWQLMAIVAVIVFGLVAFATFTQKKIYESATKVVVEGKHAQGADTASLI
ncbi:Wzz/FepE/Etk N-terminal domain-containing protein, partial [Acinetobacter baumannii]